MITVVYKLYFENTKGEYIGKSSDFKRRLMDHKRNMKNPKKTRLAKWIYENRNKELKYSILGEFNSEKDALIKEAEEILNKIKKDIFILNSTLDLNIESTIKRTNKLIERSRKTCSKKYILIDKNKKIFRAYSLRKWACDKKLNYKDLNACARNKIKSSQGFKVFYRETWIKMSKKEKLQTIINFSNYDSNLESANSRRKTFWVLGTSKIQKVTNLKEFANKNNLNVECLYLTKRNKQKKHKGFKVFSTEKEAIVYERLQKEIFEANSSNSRKLQTDNAVDNLELSQDIINNIDPNGPNGYLRGTIATTRYLEKCNDQREISYTQVSGNGEDPKGL